VTIGSSEESTPSSTGKWASITAVPFPIPPHSFLLTLPFRPCFPYSAISEEILKRNQSISPPLRLLGTVLGLPAEFGDAMERQLKSRVLSPDLPLSLSLPLCVFVSREGIVERLPCISYVRFHVYDHRKIYTENYPASVRPHERTFPSSAASPLPPPRNFHDGNPTRECVYANLYLTSH